MAIGIDIGGKKIGVVSILKFKEAVKNTIDWSIAIPKESLHMTSTASVKSIGIDGGCDMIVNGYDADFIALIPDLDLIATYLDRVFRFQVKNLIGKEGVR